MLLFLLMLVLSAGSFHADRIHDIRIDRFFGGPLAVAGSVYEVRGKLAFIGSGTFESVYMHYRVNDEDVHTTYFGDIGINPQIPFYYVAGEPWVPETEGKHQLMVWFSGLNGTPVEEGASDTLVVSVDVYDYLPTRELSLLESFSSMHCGSCAIINPGVRDMIETNSEFYAMVFYHPMAHENSPLYQFNPKDQDLRRQRYGVNSTPFAVVGSLYQGMTERVDSEMMEMEREKPGGFVVTGSYEIAGNDLTIQVETECFGSFPDRRIHLYVVLKESVVEFDEPPGSNGESTFYYVMRSFIPDAQGLPLDHQEPGSVYARELTYALDPEALDYSRLEIIVFVQDTSTGDVFQTVRLEDEADDGDNGDDDDGDDDNDETSVSGYAVRIPVRIYPNPTGGTVHIASDTLVAIKGIRVFDLQGRIVFSLATGAAEGETMTLDLSHLPDGMYLLRLYTPEGRLYENILLHK